MLGDWWTVLSDCLSFIAISEKREELWHFCGGRYLVAASSELAKFGNTMINRNWKGCALSGCKISPHIILGCLRRLRNSQTAGESLHLSPGSFELLRPTYPIHIFLFNKSTSSCRERKWTSGDMIFPVKFGDGDRYSVVEFEIKSVPKLVVTG